MRSVAGVALFDLCLDRDERGPLSRQLYLRIRERVLSRRLPPGARLPASRRLAEELGVSRTVTLTAYEQLVSEGYLEARRGSGLYVRSLGPPRPGGVTHRAPLVRGSVPAQPIVGRPFDPNACGLDSFPHSLWAKLLARSWRSEGAHVASAADWAGAMSLRTAVAHYLFTLRGIACKPEQVVITTGFNDALQLIVRAIHDSSRSRRMSAWVEDPGHLAARRLLMREGLELVPVPADANGLDVAKGIQRMRDARLALVTASRQYPLGVSMSLARRMELLAWARKAGALVIEDEYDSEVRFEGRPLPSLMSLDADGSVVAVGSFSKLLFPGLRLGYIVAPEPVATAIIAARARDGAHIPLVAQPALAEFMDQGHLARYLRALRRDLAHRRGALLDALERTMDGELLVMPQQVGLNLTVLLEPKLARRASDVEISVRAAHAGLLLEPMSPHFMRSGPTHGFLFGYAAWSAEQIHEGVRRLRRVLPTR